MLKRRARQLRAIVLDTFREARARKMFLGMTMSGILTAAVLMWYVQTISERGPHSTLTALAQSDPRYLDAAFTARAVFGAAVKMLFFIQSLFSLTLTLGFLSPLLSAQRNVVPAAAPVPRSLIVAGRYLGALGVAASGAAVSFTVVWAGTSLKLGFWHWPFLVAVLPTMLAVAAGLALMALLQIAFRSQAVVFVLLSGLSLLAAGARYPDLVLRMTGSEWIARGASALSVLLPPIAEIGASTGLWVETGSWGGGEGLWLTAACGLVSLAGACALFARQEF